MALRFLLLFLVCIPSFGQYKYLRSGATGSASGNDWANAYTTFAQLESAISRGATGYVAQGTYTTVDCDKAASGTLWITIKRATVAEHGTDTGWDDSYANGQAVFNGQMQFETLYWDFDGVTGGGPGSWTNGHGFKISFLELLEGRQRE